MFSARHVRIGAMRHRGTVETLNQTQLDGMGGFTHVYYPALNPRSAILEAGTSETTLVVSAHGLATNDYIINVTRAFIRKVTVVDDDTFTVASTPNQVSGDIITLHAYATSKIWLKMDEQAPLKYKFEDAHREHATQFDILCRWREDIKAQQIITVDGIAYEITSLMDIDNLKRTLKIVGRRGA